MPSLDLGSHFGQVLIPDCSLESSEKHGHTKVWNISGSMMFPSMPKNVASLLLPSVRMDNLLRQKADSLIANGHIMVVVYSVQWQTAQRRIVPAIKVSSYIFLSTMPF